MFSTFIRVGVALFSAAILCSCGGNSVAETQQSTPEGLFSGQYLVCMLNPNNASSSTCPVPSPAPAALVPPNPVTCTQNVLTFVTSSGTFYTFYPSAANTALLTTADQGTLSFSGGVMSASTALEVNLPGSATLGCGTTAISPKGVYSYNMTGGYTVGQNISGSLIYPTADANGYFDTTTFSLSYNSDYQGVQNLATLAGTYTGNVGTSQNSEAATFTISPASVPANGGNSLGVSLLSGTGVSGCAYTGSVSPLYKGNGYSVVITAGPSPCLLPGQEFAGLIYLNTKTNILYSFAPNQARTDGIIFSGTRS
jgi:hypothetical protein